MGQKSVGQKSVEEESLDDLGENMGATCIGGKVCG